MGLSRHVRRSQVTCCVICAPCSSFLPREVSITWVMVGQAAQALRDDDLVGNGARVPRRDGAAGEVADDADPRPAAPQALVVG